MVSLPAARSRFHCSRCRRNTFARIWSGTRKLKSGDSGAKWPTSSGLVAILSANRGIGQGQKFLPPPHSSGIDSPGLMVGDAHGVTPPDMAPSFGSRTYFGTFLSSQKIDEMYSAK